MRGDGTKVLGPDKSALALLARQTFAELIGAWVGAQNAFNPESAVTRFEPAAVGLGDIY